MAQAARRHDAFHLNPLYMDWHHTHTGVQRTMPTFKSKRTTTTSAATSMLAPTMSVARVACTQYTHVSPLQIYELGPWSSARALVDARAAAQQERNDRLAAGPKTPLPAGDLAWTPARDPAVGPRARDLVPSLFNTCVNIVVEHLDCVETLWGLPEQLKVCTAQHARDVLPHTLYTHPPHAHRRCSWQWRRVPGASSPLRRCLCLRNMALWRWCCSTAAPWTSSIFWSY